MQLGETGKVQSAINVTPLVDVVLVLLIIFMVMAPYMQQGPGPEIDMPATAKPVNQAEDATRILVTIDERGGLWIEDKEIPAEKFGERLRATAGIGPNTKVVLRGDARLPFREIRHAMLAIEDAGFHGVGLIAERSSAATQGG